MSEPQNALQTLDFGAVKTRKTDLSKFSTGGSRFLRRLQLNDNNQYVKKGLISPGHWGIPVSAEEITDLGKKIDLLLFAVREKCLDMNGEKPLAVFEPTHPDFERIYWEVYDQDKFLAAGGQLTDDGLNDSPSVKLTPIRGLNGFMHGASFLVFERSTSQLYELYLANGSGREEAKRMEVFLPIDGDTAESLGCEPRNPTPCTLQGKYINGKTHQWWAPEVLKCSDNMFDLPPMQTLVAEINKFVEADYEGGDDSEDAEEGERAR